MRKLNLFKKLMKVRTSVSCGSRPWTTRFHRAMTVALLALVALGVKAADYVIKSGNYYIGMNAAGTDLEAKTVIDESCIWTTTNALSTTSQSVQNKKNTGKYLVASCTRSGNFNNYTYSWTLSVGNTASAVWREDNGNFYARLSVSGTNRQASISATSTSITLTDNNTTSSQYYSVTQGTADGVTYYDEATGQYVITSANAHFLGGTDTNDITAFSPSTCLWTGTSGGTWKNSAGYNIRMQRSGTSSNRVYTLSLNQTSSTACTTDGTESETTGVSIVGAGNNCTGRYVTYNSGAWDISRTSANGNTRCLFVVTKRTYLDKSTNPTISGDDIIATTGTAGSKTYTSTGESYIPPYIDYVFYNNADHYFKTDNSTALTAAPTSESFTYAWSLSDGSHASVDEDGKVTYNTYYDEDTEVTLTLMATSTSGEVLTATKTLTFEAPKTDPTAITITSGSSMTVYVGNTGSITYSLTPSPCYDNVTFESSATDVATVSADGTVTGVSVGTATITAKAHKFSTTGTVDATISVTVKNKVATPVFSFEPTSADGGETATATITCATEGATISYSTDGGTTWTAYTPGFTVNNLDVVKAKAVKSGDYWDDSDVATATYSKHKVATPTITISNGQVSFSCEEEGDVTYYYTTDGSTPTTGSTQYTGAFTPTLDECTIKVIATKAGAQSSDAAERLYVVQSGTSDSKVILNDYEDHNWTYYKGVDASVDGGHYNTAYFGKLYSPNPRNVKITYNGVNNVTGSTTVVKVSTKTGEGQNSFIYYKTLEQGATTGEYPYQVISNPFSVRPSTGTTNKTYYGFNGWKIVSGGEYIKNHNNDDVLSLDEEITFVNLKNKDGGDYTPNCTSAEIVFETTWTQANVQRGGGNVSHTSFNGGTYETNFCVINAAYNNALAPTYPVTITSAEPDGSATYNVSFSNLVTPVAGAANTTKLEYISWAPSGDIDARGRNLTIGRGVTTTGTARQFYGTNQTAGATNVIDQVLKIESGTYSYFRHFTSSGTNRIRKQIVVFGCDYDRAKNDNAKLSITGQLIGATGGGAGNESGTHDANLFTNKSYMKSGTFMTDVTIAGAEWNHSYYLGINNASNATGKRLFEMEGGYLANNIAGGMDISINGTKNSDQYINVFIRIRGGHVLGSIYGGARFAESQGSRQIVLTGGEVNGWIAGGANGNETTQGGTEGASYIYVGGNAKVGGEGSDTSIGSSIGGCVYGAGCGYGPNSSSGEMRLGTNVVVADNAYVERGVYGGGAFGYCATDQTANVYITGGHVEGKSGDYTDRAGTTTNDIIGGVFGGARMRYGGSANIYMTGGQVDTGVYGGSNYTGTLEGDVKMVITGGQVGKDATHTGNIHGGGYGQPTLVNGDVDVTLGIRDESTGETSGDAVIYGDVYGGSALGQVNATGTVNNNTLSNVQYNSGKETNVTLNAGTINGSLYGGALGNNTVAANVYGPVAVKVYGGSVNTTTAAGSGAVYGCNNLNGAPQSTVAVDIYGTDPAPAENQYALDAVYGGGNMADYAAGTPTVKVHNCDNSIGSVYGGGNAADITGTGHGTNVTIYGGDVIGNVFGGGNGEREGTEANVTGNASVTIHGGTILNVFGGSNTRGTIGGTITVNIDSQGDTDGEGSADACTMNIGNVYGGGNKAASSVGTLNIGCTGTDGYIDAIYGGANAANITGNIALNITGGNIGNVFGGNNASGTISGKVDVTIGPSSDSCDGIQIANVYGGGNKADMAQDANVVTVNINGDGDAEIGNIYGGGKLASVYSTNVYLRGGTVTGNVFGGGMGSKETTALASKPMILNGGTHVYAFGGTVANIFGGNDAGGTINGGLNVIVDKTYADEATDYSSYSGYGDLEITGDVYGGGNEAASAAGAVNIKCANAIANVFGGAKNADVTGDITLNVGSGQIGNVYGGNNVGGTAGGNITVNVSKVSGDCGNNFTVGNVFGGGYGAGTNTGGNVTINITDVAITGDVYGGSALGNVNTGTSNTTAVNLLGGSVAGNVYGGGLGDATTAALVKGKVTVTLGNDDGTSVIGGSIYGANNVNGTPKGTVNVIVNKTAPQVGAAADDYDVAAVYGGGNQAAYVPDASIVATAAATVTVNGCDNSIQYVYGGGNAAPVPATNVTIWGGTYDYVFAGGNGAGEGNPGANVGYKTYADDADEDTKAAAAYGSGNAIVNFYGGSVNHLFGGSNTKGNIKGLASVNIDEGGVCPLVKVDEAYAAGNEAYMEGGAKMNIGCVDLEFPVIYGGAKKADVGQDIVLNITSGKYQKVFGGNNLGGKINGSITVNVDETGCHPVTIGELYAGGNMAAYSIYGYEADGTVKTSGTKLYDDPVVNIVSCTSIGTVYGGGYGTSATVVGNPTVNINQIPGKYAAEIDANGDSTADNDANAIGTIGNIFGGGNAAPVQGDTYVNIGTAKGTLKHIVGDDDDDIMDLEFDESSANISGNVYGGGNKAKVTGNTKVVIGPAKTE